MMTSARRLLTLPAMLIGLSLGCGAACGDLIAMAKGELEGRILENSARVLVVETVAGEYVVVQKEQVKSFTQEPAPEFYYRRANFYQQQGNEKRAVLNYLEALNRDPAHQKSRQQIENIQHAKKQEQWNNGVQQAETHLDNEQYWLALNTFQSVLDMEPEDDLARQIIKKMSDTHARIAFLYYDHCADEDAILELAKAEELNPNSAEIYYILGRIHETDRKYDLARLEYERALEIDPNHSRARTQLDELIDQLRARYIR
ncbi:MAG: tetratricopeptide repeat protein [Candidatus Omnitrophica bacterium]|nr:tetratricopeptide repeat protein [Candidatus Omnitrophota bacterium]